jgi:chromosome segregation ATPase|tara:strand:+ start:4922 stop:5155 length:234 start_codon:yes stop_codon:yes gene_type:complete
MGGMKDIMIRIQNAENERDLIAEENKKMKKHLEQLEVILERERCELREVTAERDELETERDELKEELVKITGKYMSY